MGDDETSLPLCQVGDGFLNQDFCAGVDVTGCLVEDENRCVDKHGSCNGE